MSSTANKQTANFFWHGPKLQLWNYLCVKSFVDNGFNVNVWTYDELEVPNGATICDAGKYCNREDLTSITQNGKQGCLSAFSDLFRWALLEKEDGWWFDTDCLCLKHESEFAELTVNATIVAGLEPSYGKSLVACGALNVPNKEVAHIINMLVDKTLEVTNRNIGWGQISVQMLTNLIEASPMLGNGIVDKSYFYPLIPQEALKAISTSCSEELEELTASSYVYHFWNEMMRRGGINCDEMPPQGSYLHNKFSLLL